MTETCGGAACIAWPLKEIKDKYFSRQEVKRECRLEELEEKFKAGEKLTLPEELELKGRRVGDLLDSIFSIPCKN